MAYSDEDVAVKGAMDLLNANAAFMAALGGAKVYRDTAPAVPLPTASVSASGFRDGVRPIQQGGVYNQIWSEGTVTVSVSTDTNYDSNLTRLLLNALDRSNNYAVVGAGTLYWLRYTDTFDESIDTGQRTWKLKRINFSAAAKAT